MMDFQSNVSDVSLNQLMGAFNHRIAELQQLILTRGVQVGEYMPDLSALDVTVRVLEGQLFNIKAHLKDDAETLFKARLGEVQSTNFAAGRSRHTTTSQNFDLSKDISKTLIELSSQQQKKLQQIFADLPAHLPGGEVQTEHHSVRSMPCDSANRNDAASNASLRTPVAKDKKGRGPPPRCHVSAEEFASLSSYMRGRLTLDKVNIAIEEMATFAETNTRLLATQRKKLSDDMLVKVLELREIAYMDFIKGKHFFMEADMRGQILKLDNTGKAVLTVLRHLGRISEVRVGRQRIFTIT